MAQVSTQPLTEMSTRNLPGGKGWPVHKADSITAICEPIVWKIWEPRRLANSWASTACYRESFTFVLLYVLRCELNALQNLTAYEKIIFRKNEQNLCTV
jgi:hypothetical protein